MLSIVLERLKCLIDLSDIFMQFYLEASDFFSHNCLVIWHVGIKVLAYCLFVSSSYKFV